MIIGLIGNTRVGKDTVADYLVNNYNFKKYSFSEQIKIITKTIFSWDDNKLNNNDKDNIDEEFGIIPRDFYKWLGTDIMQHEFDKKFKHCNLPKKSIWAYSVMKKINHDLNNNDDNIVITDFRFLHEFNLFNKVFKNMNYFIINKQKIDLQILNKYTDYWQYEIKPIIEIILHNKLNFNTIINNSTINNLYTNTDIIMNNENIYKNNN